MRKRCDNEWQRARDEREEAYFACIQGHVMNAKTKGGGRVSYSRITFATLESRRDTSFSRSLLLLSPRSYKDAPVPLLLYTSRTATPRYSFVYRAVCTYNETGAFGQFPRVSIALRSVPQRKISVTVRWEFWKNSSLFTYFERLRWLYIRRDHPYTHAEIHSWTTMTLRLITQW